MTYKLNRQRQNKITITNLIVIFWLLFLPFLANSQTKKIVGTYSYNYGEEYLQIKEDSFKIIRAPETVHWLDLDKGDSIAAYGGVEYINDDFVKLTSYPYYKDVYKSAKFTELHDNNLKDSLRIKFEFPFKGNFDIEVYYFMAKKSYFTKTKSITIPLITGNDIVFEISNRDIRPIDFPGNHYGLSTFIYIEPYELKDTTSNLLLVNILELTNSFYARYFIEGEYFKVEKDKIIWRNRQYKKVSDRLIDVHFDEPEHVETGETPIPDIEW